MFNLNDVLQRNARQKPAATGSARRNHMKRLATSLLAMLMALWLSAPSALAAGGAVRSAHPRLLLDPATIARLIAKKSAGDPSWRALKAQADMLATLKIFPYEF